MQIFLNIQRLKLDKLRLNKQILELGQIISTSLRINNQLNLKDDTISCLYKKCYINHPIVKWAYLKSNLIFCVNYIFSLDLIRTTLFVTKTHGTCNVLVFLKKFTNTVFICDKDIFKYFFYNELQVPLYFDFKNFDLKQNQNLTNIKLNSFIYYSNNDNLNNKKLLKKLLKQHFVLLKLKQSVAKTPTLKSNV